MNPATEPESNLVDVFRLGTVARLALALQDGDRGQADTLLADLDPAFVLVLVQVLNETGADLHGVDGWRERCVLVASEADYAVHHITTR